MAKKEESAKRRTGIQVIARAANVLRALEHEPKGLSLGEIAKRIALPRSTVQRIVEALTAEQLLISATPTSRVTLGPAIIRLAASVRMDMTPLLRPIIEALSLKTNETVDLSILDGRKAVFVDQVSGNHRLRAVSSVGERFPIHCTACGKALLSELPSEKREKVLEKTLSTHTKHTKIDKKAVLAEIDACKKLGMMVDMEEHTIGISAIGFGFTDMLNRVYAISIPAPTDRFLSSQETLKTLLMGARKEVLALITGSLH